jgi:chromosome segregation ATPase
MAIEDGNKRFLNLFKRMSIKLAQSSTPEFIKSGLPDLLNSESEYLTKINSLKEKIQSYEKQLHDIPQVEKINHICREQENKIKNLENLIESIKDKKINLESKELLITIEDLKSKIKSLKDKNKELQDSIDGTKKVNQKYKATITTLENKISEINNKAYGEIIESKKLRTTLHNERNKIKQLEADKKELEFAIRRLENRLLMNGRLIGLSIPVRSIGDLSGDKKTESSDSIQFQAEIRRMSMELNKKTERIKTLEFEIKDLQEKLDQSDTRDIQLENEKLKQELEKKNSTILDFKTLRKKMTVQIRNLQNRITDLQNELKVRTDEVESNRKVINELETAVKTGIKDADARDIITKLQSDSKELRSEIKAMDSAIRAQDKTNFGMREQVKDLKNQLAKLYNQSKWQLSQLHRYHEILERAGIDPSSYGLDKSKITADFKRIVQSDDRGSGIGAEISKKDKKIQQLENYVGVLEKDMEEIKFRLMSRDVKINELEDIINDIKIQVAKKGLKIQV